MLLDVAGFYAPLGNAPALGAAIRQALADDGSRAQAAHERIVNNFTIAHRERLLIAEVGRLLQPRRDQTRAGEELGRARPR